MVNGKTRLCGLIGNPVEHTLSPMIHNSLAESTGENLVYVPFLVEAGAVGQALTGAYALNVLGLNVTVPYKSMVLPFLGQIDTLAEKIGAVNTLVRTQGGFKGYNTDMSGLYRALRSEGIELGGEEVIVLGAGGAARAVAFLCAYYGAAKVYLMNRTLEKAQAVAAEVNAALDTNCVCPMCITDYGKLPDRKYLCIQGTSVGLFPDTQKCVIMDREFYKLVHTGYDLIYRPAVTKFMTLVEEAGGRAYHGLKMLLYQGIDAYELWNDARITEETANALYAKMKDEMGIYE